MTTESPVADAISQAQDMESEKSSSMSDDDDLPQDAPVTSNPAPDTVAPTDEPKKEGKKKSSGQSPYITFDLATHYASKVWDATLLTKTGCANVTAAFGKMPVSDSKAGTLSLSDLEKKPSATLQKKEYITVDEQGVMAINFMNNVALDILAKRWKELIHQNHGATLTMQLVLGGITSSFAPSWADKAIESINLALARYDSELAKRDQNAILAKNEELAKQNQNKGEAPAGDGKKPEAEDEESEDSHVPESEEPKAPGAEKEAPKNKSPRTPKAKLAGLHISVGKIHTALNNRGIPRMSDRVDIAVAALMEELFVTQLLLHTYIYISETHFVCTSILSAMPGFEPCHSLGINVRNLCIPMYGTSNFEKGEHGCLRFANPLSITRNKDEVIFETRVSDIEKIEELRKKSAPGESWLHYSLNFNHILSSKGKKETSLQEPDIKTVGKIVKKEEKKKRKRDKGPVTPAAAAEEVAKVPAPEQREVPLKKKSKKVKF